MPFSLQGATLLCGVPHILRAGAKEQVLWIHTLTVIAVMTYLQARWYGSYEKLIGIPMGTDSVTGMRVETTVSSTGMTAGPCPASIWPIFVYIGPETFALTKRTIRIVTRPATKSLSSFRMGVGGNEELSALFTN